MVRKTKANIHWRVFWALLCWSFFITEIQASESLADYFMKEADYYRAGVEYQREAYQSADSSIREKKLILSAGAYYAGKNYTGAVKILRNLSMTIHSQWLLYLSLRDAGYADNALQTLQKIDSTDMVEYEKKVLKLRYSIHKLPLDSEIQDFSTAPPSKYPFVSQPVLKIAGKDDILSFHPVNRNRNPWGAAILSAVLPGAGQFYTGQYGDGFTYLGIISLFSGLGILALANDEPATAYGSFALASAFYAANIYGAVRSVNVENRRIEKEYVERVILLGYRYSPAGSSF